MCWMRGGGVEGRRARKLRKQLIYGLNNLSECTRRSFRGAHEGNISTTYVCALKSTEPVWIWIEGKDKFAFICFFPSSATQREREKKKLPFDCWLEATALSSFSLFIQSSQPALPISYYPFLSLLKCDTLKQIICNSIFNKAIAVSSKFYCFKHANSKQTLFI